MYTHTWHTYVYNHIIVLNFRKEPVRLDSFRFGSAGSVWFLIPSCNLGTSCFQGFGDGAKGFYAVYSDLFVAINVTYYKLTYSMIYYSSFYAIYSDLFVAAQRYDRDIL